MGGKDAALVRRFLDNDGAFGEDLAVGDVLLPPKILSEEGTSRHYFENPEFCTVESRCAITNTVLPSISLSVPC